MPKREKDAVCIRVQMNCVAELIIVSCAVTFDYGANREAEEPTKRRGWCRFHAVFLTVCQSTLR